MANLPDVFQHEYVSLETKDPIIRAKRYIVLQGTNVSRLPHRRLTSAELTACRV